MTPALHILFETLAFMVGGLLYWRGANASTQPPEILTRWGLLAGAALGAAIGSRLLYVAQYWTALSGQPLASWLGGKTIVGGLLGAVAGVESAKYLLGWNQSTGDGFALPLLVAIAIGRIGCQLSGLNDLTYGNVTTLPWGWNYGDGLLRHPTALYEILGLLPLACLVYYTQVARRPGDRFRLLMIGYLVVRLGLDYLKPPFGAAARGALSPDRWGLFTPIQWACIAGLAYYGRDIWRFVGGRASQHA
jgi:phosphatidylglycerol---prolipoprotein diacylglyceryl transferase